MKCNSSKTACGCSTLFLLTSIVLLILYITKRNDKYGELAMYLLCFSFVLWIVTINIKQESNTKVYPINNNINNI